MAENSTVNGFDKPQARGGSYLSLLSRACPSDYARGRAEALEDFPADWFLIDVVQSIFILPGAPEKSSSRFGPLRTMSKSIHQERLNGICLNSFPRSISVSR
jgi:hypothetical protein